MRKIKFRCWYTDEGYTHYTISELVEAEFWPVPFKKYDQYTGLKDKNGTEIYEGDILRNGVFHFIVEWGYSSEDGGTYGYDISVPYDLCEVVGNIHENKGWVKNERKRS